MNVSDYKRISFDGAYDNGDYFYVSSELYNGLLKVNCETHQADYLCAFPDSKADILGQHHKVHKYEDSLIFAPDNAKGIHLYNMQTKQLMYIEIDGKISTKTRCIDSHLVGCELWLLYAYAEHPIVMINLDTFQINRFDELKKMLPKKVLERSNPLFWSVFTRCEEKLYGAVWHSSYILEINTDTRMLKLIKLQDIELELTTVVSRSGLLFGAEREGMKVTCWNLEGEFVERYILEESVQMHEKGNFSNLILCNENIYLVTNLDNYIYYLDREKKLIKELVGFPENFETFEDTRKKWRRFFSYDVIGAIIRLYPTNANMMLDIDVVNRTVRGYKFVLDEKYDDDWYRRTFIYPKIEESGEGKVLRETEQLALEDYIGFVGWM